MPNDFQQNVIVQEFRIDKGGVELTELIELYQSAVEYYDSIGDVANAALYKEKMVLLFTKPHVSRLFQPKKEKATEK